MESFHAKADLSSFQSGDLLLCPICSEEMLTLTQLNQHLDDSHASDDTAGAVLGWLHKTQKKIVGFTKSKSLTGLNEILSPQSANNESRPEFIGNVDEIIANGKTPLIQREYSILRDHWQKETGNDQCSKPNCRRGLGIRNGKQNCRKCGKLYCDTHCNLSMKLSMSARHDPLNGVWSRVCESCFTGKEGYKDHHGVFVNKTDLFLAKRKKVVKNITLESNLLEKRVEKLTKLYLENPQSSKSSPSTSSWRSSMSSLNKVKVDERSIVKWEDDQSVLSCPMCQTPFTLTFRRHHCRLDGRIICGSEKCSTLIGLTSNGPIDQGSSYNFAPDSGIVAIVRACRTCKFVIFRNRESDEKWEKLRKLYEYLTRCKIALTEMLPKFNAIIIKLR